MSKNIVVFSDGTGQDGGVRPEQRISNIYKLYWTSRNHPGNAMDPHGQVSFYDAGLGTDIGSTAMTAPVRFAQKMLGSVTGEGIKRNIADCYEFIINHYEPGDRIFLFGFSRGAYTARCVANLLMLCGIPTKGRTGRLIRFRKTVRDIAWEAVDTVLEHGAGHPRAEFEAERIELARRFQVAYGSGNGSDSNAAPYFIGVFDTVAALGATGMRRQLIHLGLGAGVAIAAVLGAIIPALAIAGVVDRATGLGFWWPFWLLVVGAGIVANLVFWPRQKAANIKTIRDFPNKGDVSTHSAEWKGANFDRLLSKHVGYARSANAIDETRKDFDRVPWGQLVKQGREASEDRTDLVQLWFAGNHSDVGGSYPEAESRLSDAALAWMAEKATEVPDGLKTGPIFVNGDKMPNTADVGQPLYLYPRADGVQHCEIAGTQDTLDSYAEKLPAFLRKLLAGRNWEVKIRTIDDKARVHPTVDQRFTYPSVAQCAGGGPYRPAALRDHEKFKALYIGGG
ncbi:MAG: DUF2235 domain-containing protein [Rhizobiales bacterium]|nr:DUF2235 domain-containing protein [Hyphomicrobiales bacterium]